MDLTALHARARMRILNIHVCWEMSIYYPDVDDIQLGYSGLDDIQLGLGAGFESQSPELQVKAAAGEAQRAGSFRDVAAGAVEGGLNEIALHLFDGGGQVTGHPGGSALRKPSGDQTGGPDSR